MNIYSICDLNNFLTCWDRRHPAGRMPAIPGTLKESIYNHLDNMYLSYAKNLTEYCRNIKEIIYSHRDAPPTAHRGDLAALSEGKMIVCTIMGITKEILG